MCFSDKRPDPNSIKSKEWFHGFQETTGLRGSCSGDYAVRQHQDNQRFTLLYFQVLLWSFTSVMAPVFAFCLLSLSHLFLPKRWQSWFSSVWREKPVAVKGWGCREAAGDRGWTQGWSTADEARWNDRDHLNSHRERAEKAGRCSDLWEEVATLGLVLIDLADRNCVSCARQKWCECASLFSLNVTYALSWKDSSEAGLVWYKQGAGVYGAKNVSRGRKLLYLLFAFGGSLCFERGVRKAYLLLMLRRVKRRNRLQGIQTSNKRLR